MNYQLAVQLLQNFLKTDCRPCPRFHFFYRNYDQARCLPTPEEIARGSQLRKEASLPRSFTLSTKDDQLPLGATRIFRLPGETSPTGSYFRVKLLGSPALSLKDSASV
jgi:hypothetical protein